MEERKGTAIEKWSDVDGAVKDVEEAMKDPNALGNIMRGIEDQIEQNDNMLDGIINNKPEETIAEKEARTSIVQKLKDIVPEKSRKPVGLYLGEER